MWALNAKRRSKIMSDPASILDINHFRQVCWVTALGSRSDQGHGQAPFRNPVFFPRRLLLSSALSPPMRSSWGGASTSRCPSCGAVSHRVYSRYIRRPFDLQTAGIRDAAGAG